MKSGYIQIDIEEYGIVPFRFGMAFWENLLLYFGKQEIEELTSIFTGTGFQEVKNTQGFLFCAYQCACQLAGEPVLYSKYDAIEWINLMTDAQMGQVTGTFLDSKLRGKPIREVMTSQPKEKKQAIRPTEKKIIERPGVAS